MTRQEYWKHQFKVSPKGFVKGGVPHVSLYAGDTTEPDARIDMPLRQWAEQVAKWEGDEAC